MPKAVQVATMCTGVACQDLPGGAEHESKIQHPSHIPNAN